MTEITRVPLQPIAKGSILRIWIGIALALVVALGLAFAARYHGLRVETVAAGTGAPPTAQDVVLINYVGHLGNGSEFDRGEKVAMPLDGVVPGFSQGLQKMQKGGKYKLTIPSNLGYGAEEKKDSTGKVRIPANSELVFDIELLDYMNADQLRQMQAMQMQQLQGMRHGKGGPGGAPGAGGGAPDMPPGAMPPGAGMPGQ
jgi:FKBP-type peptidyl-prolyl cis-trans isomerase FkpA